MSNRPNHTLRPSRKMLPVDARRHHRAMVLQVLFREGPRSRADLARATGLTRVTVSDVVTGLIGEGLVVELGAQAATRVGKPATLVGLDPDACHIVTLDVSPDTALTGAVLNLSGEVLARRSLPLDDASGAEAERRTVELARELIAASTRPVLGVGIASPGIVDGGVVRDAPNLGWVNLDLAGRASRSLGVGVQVANDANTAAMGELAYGDAAVDGLLVLRIGHGVGAGLVVDGRLVGGRKGAAGEIGHVVVDPDGRPCACGRRGCLETLLAAPRLRAAIADVDDAGRAQVLGDLGRTLGIVLAPVAAALNLREIVLSGPPDLLAGPLADAAAATIAERTMPVIGGDLPVRVSSLGQDAQLLGAAGLVLAAELGVS